MNTPGILIAVVGASALSSLLTATFVIRERSPLTEAVSWSGLEQQLKDLAADVTELKLASRAEVVDRPVAASNARRTSVDAPDREVLLLGELAELRQLVEKLSWRTGIAAADLSRLSEGHASADWDQLTALSKKRGTSREVQYAAERELFLMTAAQVLEKFGRPTNMEPEPGGATMWWYVRKDPSDSMNNIKIAFYIKDGLLVGVR